MQEFTKEERMNRIASRLRTLYPDAVCALEWQEAGMKEENEENIVRKNGWRLLVMGRLSAQCTDVRVNMVSRELFARYPTCRALADAPIAEIEELIRPCGLFRTKAASIKAACGILCDRYDGCVPDQMEELLALPGVGRKIANLLLGDLYGQPAVVADTHLIRLCGRWGMYPQSLKDPVAVERLMRSLLSPTESADFCHRVVQFGRDFCSARAPACKTCPLCDLCPSALQTNKMSIENNEGRYTKKQEKICKKEKNSACQS